ncbi:MAG TPA: hypothetical protein VIO35_05250 [Chloroflexota bacterium]|jgi:hypothetical protein
MPLETERLEILKMVQSKQITPEDGARLLRAVTDGQPQVPVRSGPVAQTGIGRFFRLAVEQPGRERVNLTIPLQVVPTILGFVSRWVPEEHRPALQAVSEAITTGFRGDILQVDQPGAGHVHLWIE